MVEMIRYVTTEETFASDLVDAMVFLRRRLVRTVPTAEATQQLVDALRNEWGPGMTITDWVSRSAVRINRSGPPEIIATDRPEDQGTGLPAPMDAAEFRYIVDRLGLAAEALAALLSHSEQTISRWGSDGLIPLPEARLLRIMVRLAFTPQQMSELSDERIEPPPAMNFDLPC